MFVRLAWATRPVTLPARPMRLLLLSLMLLSELQSPGQSVAPPAAHADSVTNLVLRVTGAVDHLAPFGSRFVAPRAVDVWLPSGYHNAAAATHRYPVLYVHDGQNVFDPATSFIGVDWALDETLTRLIAEAKVPEIIVVAVWNTPKRLSEYMPQRAIESVSDAELDEMFKPVRRHPLGDAYLKYLVTELKPAIDARYRTQADRDHTFIMGSSMGGLISLYALCEYPEVFGGAACLSSAWTVAGGVTTRDLKSRLPDPRSHRIYFDFGAESEDGRYEPLQQQVDKQMREAGYTAGSNWITKSFPGEPHSERSWRNRVHEPLEFLFQPKTASQK